MSEAELQRAVLELAKRHDAQGRVSTYVDGKRIRRVADHLRRRTYVRGTAVERALARVEKNDAGCWIWRGALTPAGYANMNKGDGTYGHAHRLLYEHFVGPIPAGLVLDHLCRVRGCVNPQHLEPVTDRENILRGERGGVRRTGKCGRGHDQTVHGYVSPKGRRQCRECLRMRRTAA